MAARLARFVNACRTWHTVLTMLSLLAVSLFAATGLMLNHPAWFGLEEAQKTTSAGAIDAAAARSAEQAAVVKGLRDRLGVSGAMESYDPDEKEIVVIFRQPGRQTRAIVHREDGSVEIATESRGLAGLLGDLHTGRSAGKGWGILIDATAVLLVLSVVTGLIVWLATPRRRLWGALALVVGAAVWTGAYFLLAARQ
jgi:uncharacterized protein